LKSKSKIIAFDLKIMISNHFISNHTQHWVTQHGGRVYTVAVGTRMQTRAAPVPLDRLK